MRPHNPVSDQYLYGNYRRIFDLQYSEKSPSCTLAAPCNYVRQDAPPFLIVHGIDDELISYRQSERLAESLKNAGAHAELCLLPGVPHHSPFWTNCREIHEITLGFLDRLFYPDNNK